MAQFDNQLPVSASVRYTATDNTKPLQHVNAHFIVASIKDVKPSKNVSVTAGGVTHNTMAPLNANQATLAIIQGAGNAWQLQWV
ncbi:hypothetical protein [Pontimicrobium sp. SW4]|uniref:Uncharacterized protein n=1 Tax=Pontimicrobium sp. SW4 TaxID=3153519 RepID=A0AAU7BP11_9FLAO